MRHNLRNKKVDLLKYGIREIVLVANRIKKLAPEREFIWENIGDPVAKGWIPPEFFKKIIKDLVAEENKTFAYAPSHGLAEAKEWVVKKSLAIVPESKITAVDVLFVNGLGAAINNFVYRLLPAGLRVIGPAPAYPTHVSAESFAAYQKPLLYELDPKNCWQPNLENLEEKIKAHQEIAGILLINPNNPTGAVYSAEILNGIVDLAQKYGLFLISDEIYYQMIYNGANYIQLAKLAAGRVPLLIMRGGSKDIPWPGGRSGWLEFHNRYLDKSFTEYAQGIFQSALMEVCATSLPQYVILKVYDHPEFFAYLEANNKKLAQNSKYIAGVLNSIEGLRCNPAQGAFYLMPVFDEGVLNRAQTLPIENPKVEKYIEELVGAPDISLDKRFVYYLLAATGICVVPATDFYTPHLGFRVTTLERDPEKLKNTYRQLKQALEQYLKSA